MAQSRDFIQSIRDGIDDLWDAGRKPIDWMKFEAIVTDVLRATNLTETMQLKIVKEALDAATHRGHFVGEYPRDEQWETMIRLCAEGRL